MAKVTVDHKHLLAFHHERGRKVEGDVRFTATGVERREHDHIGILVVLYHEVDISADHLESLRRHIAASGTDGEFHFLELSFLFDSCLLAEA